MLLRLLVRLIKFIIIMRYILVIACFNRVLQVYKNQVIYALQLWATLLLLFKYIYWYTEVVTINNNNNNN